MNRQEFEDAARRYREELFRLYAARQIDPPPKPVPVQSASDDLLPQGIGEKETPPAAPEAQSDLPAQNEKQLEEDAPPQTAEPDLPPSSLQEGLPDYPADEPPETDDNAVFPEPEGGILVHVRTARGSRPVPGATVLVTRQTDGLPELIAVQITDACGDTPELCVPAPASASDQQYPAYARYDITVHAEGYYRENSADVPVFEGVVSVQSFDLIPLPAGQTENGTGAQTFYNDMPRP